MSSHTPANRPFDWAKLSLYLSVILSLGACVGFFYDRGGKEKSTADTVETVKKDTADLKTDIEALKNKLVLTNQTLTTMSAVDEAHGKSIELLARENEIMKAQQAKIFVKLEEINIQLATISSDQKWIIRNLDDNTNKTKPTHP